MIQISFQVLNIPHWLSELNATDLRVNQQIDDYDPYNIRGNILGTNQFSVENGHLQVLITYFKGVIDQFWLKQERTRDLYRLVHKVFFLNSINQ